MFRAALSAAEFAVGLANCLSPAAVAEGLKSKQRSGRDWRVGIAKSVGFELDVRQRIPTSAMVISLSDLIVGSRASSHVEDMCM